MNNSPLQVGLDISQKRLDMCVMQPNGAVLMNHRSFANNRHCLLYTSPSPRD